MAKEGRNHFNNTLKKHRKVMGYSLLDVAYLLNLKSANRLTKWEQGTAKPGVKNLLMLSIVYRTLADTFYEEKRNELRAIVSEREQGLLDSKKTKSNVDVYARKNADAS